jgi:integrase
MNLGAGLHLGYWRGAAPVGKWLMRRYQGKGSQSYVLETLATADDIDDADHALILSFDQAQAKARQMHGERSRVEHGFPAKAGAALTVADCVRAYLDALDRAGRAKDARTRAESMIIPTLGHLRIDRLAKNDIEKWLHDLASAPPRLRSRKGEIRHKQIDLSDADTVRARRATANRTLTVLRAALTRAWRDGKIPNNSTWATVEPFRQVDAARIRFLEVAELQRLVNAAEPDFRNLLKGAIYTGARYSELTALEARDFKPEVAKLHIRIAKGGKGRYVALTDEGATFFAELTAGKASDAAIFVDADGARWGRSAQSQPMREACRRARVTPPISFHILRHCYAGHAVQNGASLQVVARALGHSSIKMTEAHYAHLQPSYEDEQIRAAALRLGLAPDRKVAPIRSRRRPA